KETFEHKHSPSLRGSDRATRQRCRACWERSSSSHSSGPQNSASGVPLFIRRVTTLFLFIASLTLMNP
ncbi:hypothetical protein KUCAC02_028211, partial [Chaenocephalus aceratus]